MRMVRFSQMPPVEGQPAYGPFQTFSLIALWRAGLRLAPTRPYAWLFPEGDVVSVWSVASQNGATFGSRSKHPKAA